MLGSIAPFLVYKAGVTVTERVTTTESVQFGLPREVRR